MPPKRAMRKTPITVTLLKWSGRRQSSAPFRALTVAANRSREVKLRVPVELPERHRTGEHGHDEPSGSDGPGLEQRAGGAVVPQLVDREARGLDLESVEAF